MALIRITANTFAKCERLVNFSAWTRKICRWNKKPRANNKFDINSATRLELNKALNSSDRLFFFPSNAFVTVLSARSRAKRAHAHLECKFFSGPLLFCIIGRENYAFSGERDRYPHNYFLIERFARRESEFQFAAQGSNAFMPREKRSRNHSILFAAPAPPSPYLYLDVSLPISLPSRKTRRSLSIPRNAKFLGSLGELDALQRFSQSALPIVRVHRTYVSALFFVVSSPRCFREFRHANHRFPRANRRSRDLQKRAA